MQQKKFLYCIICICIGYFFFYFWRKMNSFYFKKNHNINWQSRNKINSMKNIANKNSKFTETVNSPGKSGRNVATPGGARHDPRAHPGPAGRVVRRFNGLFSGQKHPCGRQQQQRKWWLEAGSEPPPRHYGCRYHTAGKGGINRPTDLILGLGTRTMWPVWSCRFLDYSGPKQTA